MKTLFICGSQRKGNTEYVLNKIYDDVTTKKAIIYLKEASIKNCDGCLTCKSNLECHIKDDMTEIEQELKTADTIVFGIPNYFDNISGLSKAFIDRCHPLYQSEALAGKNIYFIFVGGGKEEGTEKYLLNALQGFIKYLKLNYIGNTTYRALNPNDLKNSNINTASIAKLLNNL